MKSYGPKLKRSGGKAPEKMPHTLGRAGGYFCPGGSDSEYRGTGKTWAPDLKIGNSTAKGNKKGPKAKSEEEGEE